MDRAAYERDVLNTIAAMAAGPVHDAQTCEIRAQTIFFGALARMRAAIATVNDLSAVTRLDPQTFEDFVHDEWPDEKSWDARLAEVNI